MHHDHGETAENNDPNFGISIINFDAKHSEHNPRDQEEASEMLGSRPQNFMRSSD